MDFILLILFIGSIFIAFMVGVEHGLERVSAFFATIAFASIVGMVALVIIPDPLITEETIITNEYKGMKFSEPVSIKRIKTDLPLSIMWDKTKYQITTPAEVTITYE